jgi:hypothetical protein
MDFKQRNCENGRRIKLAQDLGGLQSLALNRRIILTGTVSSIYIVTCTRDEMTGSTSDDWILLALWLQPLVITLT